MESVVSDKLRQHHDKIEYAFVYGSVARNDQEPDSDIDLMLIGALTLKDVSSAIKGIESTLGRQVNPTLYTMQTFRERLLDGNPFIEDVMRKPKLFVEIGKRISTVEEFRHELGAMAKESLA